MGQPISVSAQRSSTPHVLRFEINRSLTGMSHERYESPADAVAQRPVDELARRLFAHGGVRAVHVNSNVITVELAGGSTGAGLDDVIANLFRFYPDAPEEPTAATVDEVVAAAEAGTEPREERADVPEAAAAPEVAAETADATGATTDEAPDHEAAGDS
jgi:hypothetical protein